MASRISPYIDNTGLVFAYDLANVQRSYLGQPATNLITSGLPGYFGSGGETLYQQSLLGLTSDSGVFQRNYITSPNSGNNGGLYKNFTTSALNAATRYVQISFDFYMITRYRTFSSSGVGLNGYIGITNTDSTTDTYGWDTRYCNGSGDDWSNDEAYVGRWQKVSLIAALRGDKNPASINAMYIYYDFFTQGEGIFTSFIITETPTLPTGPVRYTAGTRSVTQGLKDLTGRSTIDLTNVSFDSNAQMTFDGTNDVISLSPVPEINERDYSLETVVYRASTGVTHGIWSDLQYGFFGVFIDTDNKVHFRHMTNPTYVSTELISNTSINVGTYHIVNTYSLTGGFKTYVNGVLDVSTSATTIYNLTGRGLNKLGVYESGAPSNANSLNGKIHLAKVYYKTLSASEIQQNFNAIKGRYGL